jgi:antirestriction protein ArdC
MKSERFDIHQEITNRIVEAIEAGAGDFKMPWHVSADLRSPLNAQTKRAYRGVNVLTLWLTSHVQGYGSAEWATFKQWQERGCTVRKGEKGTPIVFYKQLIGEQTDPDTGSAVERRIPFARASWVFNAAQVDGAELPPPPAPLAPLFERIERVDQVVSATGATIEHGGQRAFYRPSTDSVHMPESGLFTGTATSTPQEAYYSTLLHELGHWTGHERRLNRTKGKRFGDQAYAFEELVAELTAAFLCNDLQISVTPRQDHAQYLASWLKVLKDDKRAIFTAASEASAAASFITKTAEPAESEAA